MLCSDWLLLRGDGIRGVEWCSGFGGLYKSRECDGATLSARVFFWQMTGCEWWRRLVASEPCIRERNSMEPPCQRGSPTWNSKEFNGGLLYTCDADDEENSVDFSDHVNI